MSNFIFLIKIALSFLYKILEVIFYFNLFSCKIGVNQIHCYQRKIYEKAISSRLISIAIDSELGIEGIDLGKQIALSIAANFEAQIPFASHLKICYNLQTRLHNWHNKDTSLTPKSCLRFPENSLEYS